MLENLSQFYHPTPCWGCARAALFNCRCSDTIYAEAYSVLPQAHVGVHLVDADGCPYPLEAWGIPGDVSPEVAVQWLDKQI